MATSLVDTSPYDAVFIDTSFDTHFATIVSFSDTVSDLKKKIIDEHFLCFPQFGEIKIHALKVKRSGFFYHLSDSMFVKSAFHGVNTGWFLRADASSSVKEYDDDYRRVNDIVDDGANGANQTLLPYTNPEKLSNAVDNHHLKQKVPVVDGLSLDVASGDVLNNLEVGDGYIGTGSCSKVKSLDTNNNSYDKENEIQRTPVGGKESNSRNEIGGVQGNFLSGTVLENESQTKKKHKSKKKNKHVVHDLVSKEDVLTPESRKSESQQEIVMSTVSHDNVMENRNVLGRPSTVEQGLVMVSPEGSALLQKHVELKSDELKRIRVESAEDVLQEPARKKKRKIEEGKYGDEELLKRNGTSIADSNKGMTEPSQVPQQPLVDKQNNSNHNLGSSFTETPEDAHLQSGGRSIGKEKKNKKSKAALNQESAVHSSGTDIGVEGSGREINPKNLGEEPDTELLPGQHVQGGISSEPVAVSLKEKHGDPVQEVNKKTSCQEISMSNLDAGNVEDRHNALSSAIGSDAISKKVSDHHPTIDVRGSLHLQLQESDNTGKEVKVSRLENMIFRHYQNPAVDQSNEVEEQNLALNLTPTNVPVPSENYKSAELASKTKEVTAKLLEACKTVDPLKSSKKRKKSKKTEELGSGTAFTSVTEHAEGFVSRTSPTEPHKAATGDNVTVEESNVPPKEGNEVSEMETSASFLATEKEIDDVIRNVVQSVQQIGQVEVSAENVDGKSRKKTKKKRTSDAKKRPESKKENEKLSTTSANTTKRGAEYSSNDLPHSQSSQVEPQKTNSSSKGRCLEAIVNDNLSKSGHANEGADNLEVSCESSGINFNKFFVPYQKNHKIVDSGEVLVDRGTKAAEADGETKTNKNKSQLGVQSYGASLDLQTSHSLNGNHEVGVKLSKVSDSRVKALPSSRSGKLNSVPEEARPSNAAKPSATSTHAKSKKAASNSSFKSSKDISFLNRRANGSQPHENHNRMNSSKTFSINGGEVVNDSQHKKSLIGVSDSIFKDVTDEASSTEDDNSDSSTRTPSDKSLSSGYSDGESNADVNLSQNGSDSWKRKDGGGKPLKKSFYSGKTLDTILRSSSRYKKAKLTATQAQLEDTESQPVEFVPDSQANL